MDNMVDEREEKDERVKRFFKRLALLDLDSERKEEMSQQIISDSKGDQIYWVGLVLSTIIVTFGLLQNSVAVIIGAMLIAPFLRPIKGVAFSIASGKVGNFWRAFNLLLWSTVISVGLSYVFSLIVPLRVETSEILIRTTPNLLDFFIAVASGIIAILALSYSRLSEGIAGVAMAAALLPPLGVVGIELSFRHWDLALGSLLLFFTNILAILVVGTIIFILYGFSPHQAETSKRLLQKISVLIGLIVIISIPLFSSLTQIAEKISLQRKAQIFLENSLAQAHPSAKLSKLDVLELNDEGVHLLGVMKIPEGSEFFKETQATIRNQLGKALGKNVRFDVEILRIASIQSKEEKEKAAEPSVKEQLNSKFLELFDVEVPEATVISTEFEQKKGVEDSWLGKVVFSLPAGVAFSEDEKQNLENELMQGFEGKDLEFSWVLLSQKSPEVSDEYSLAREEFYKGLEAKWEKLIEDKLQTGANVENLKISWVMSKGAEVFKVEDIIKFEVEMDLFVSKGDEEWTGGFQKDLAEFAKNNFEEPVEIRVRIFEYSGVDISSDDFNGALGGN